MLRQMIKGIEAILFSPSKRRLRRSPCKRRSFQYESLERRALMTIDAVSVFSLGGVQQDGGSRVVFDAQDNQYLYGDFSATVDFDPARTYADNRDVLTSQGGIDMFVAKYSSDRSLVWVRGFGNSSTDQTIDETEGLAVDANGNVYAAAIFYDTVNYDGFVLTQPVGASGGANVLLRLSPEGQVDWAALMGDGTLQFAVADTQNGPLLFAAGAIYSAHPTEIGGLAVSTSNNAGFLARIDTSTGQADWIVQTAGSGSANFRSIAVDAVTSSVYLTGWTTGQVIMGDTPPLTSGGTNKFLPTVATVAKADFNGDFVWSRVLATNPKTKGNQPDFMTRGLEIAVNQGDIYVAGTMNAAAKFDNIAVASAGGQDAWFARLHADGTVVWANGVGSTANDLPSRVAADSSGNIFSSVRLGASAQLGGKPSTAGNYVIQLSSSGQVLDRWRIGANFDSASRTGIPAIEGLTVDLQGNVWATGNFYGTNTFPDGTTLTSLNQSGDLFLLKFVNSVPLMPLAARSIDALETEPSHRDRTVALSHSGRLHDAVFDQNSDASFVPVVRDVSTSPTTKSRQRVIKAQAMSKSTI